MLIKQNQACLLFIDIQSKLLPVIHNQEVIIAKSLCLAKLAKILRLPMVISEQCADKIGHTVDELSQTAIDAEYIAKNSFPILPEHYVGTSIDKVKQIILCGIEAHVCVLQTALVLMKAQKEVFVLVDAIGSRRCEDKEIAIMRMAQAGVQVITTEMLAFECLENTQHPKFSTILKDFIR